MISLKAYIFVLKNLLSKLRELRTKLPSRCVLCSPQEPALVLLRKHSSLALLLQATADSNNSRTLSVVFRQPHIRQASPEPMREGWPFRDSPVSTVLKLQVWATSGYSALGTQTRALRVLGEHMPKWATSLAPKLFFRFFFFLNHILLLSPYFLNTEKHNIPI